MPESREQGTSNAGLVVADLAKSYGGVQALDGVSFELRAGECAALIGPNGAGKSTCFACLAGQVVPTRGSVSWAGRALGGLSPQARLRAGVARTFQVAQVFEALTVLQNIELTNTTGTGHTADFCLEMLKKVDLAPLAGELAGHLPYGAKKRLELAMALASRAQLLLLDEPAAGLAQAERHSLMRLIRGLAHPDLGSAGALLGGAPLTVLYTEHNMDAVFGVADRVLVLIDGRLVADGSPDAVRADPLVQARYLRDADASSATAPQSVDHHA